MASILSLQDLDPDEPVGGSPELYDLSTASWTDC